MGRLASPTGWICASSGINNHAKDDAPHEQTAPCVKPKIQSLTALSQNLSRRNAVWVELCHVFDFEDLVAIDVILQLKLDDECDEETYKSWNQRPRKSLNRRCSEHRKESNEKEISHGRVLWQTH